MTYIHSCGSCPSFYPETDSVLSSIHWRNNNFRYTVHISQYLGQQIDSHTTAHSDFVYVCSLYVCRSWVWLLGWEEGSGRGIMFGRSGCEGLGGAGGSAGGRGWLAGWLATGEGVSSRQWVWVLSVCQTLGRWGWCRADRYQPKFLLWVTKNPGYCTRAESTVLIDG